MAASSFVGEKEKRTLETLLYCPLSLKQIFYAKILASFFMSMVVTFASFAVMMLFTEIEIFLITGSLLIPDFIWLITMLLVSPAISVIAITITVHGSAKAQSMEESQQRASFLIMPLVFVMVGQFSGILLVNAWVLLVVGLVLVLIAWLLVRGIMKNVAYETILR